MLFFSSRGFLFLVVGVISNDTALCRYHKWTQWNLRLCLFIIRNKHGSVYNPYIPESKLSILQ